MCSQRSCETGSGMWIWSRSLLPTRTPSRFTTLAGTPTAVQFGRDFLKNHGVGGDFGVVAYLHRSQNSCARADQHVVSQGRVALSGVLAGAAECDILVERTVVADFSGLADNDARAVVDKQTLADLSAGVYLNAGSVAAAL